MELTNLQMSNYLIFLNNISKKVTGKLGYAVARNIRKLSNECLEFEMIRNELIEKYGEKNENGISILKIDSPNYKEFENEIYEYMIITHSVDIFKVDEDLLCNSNLTAEEMLNIDFMINTKD